MKPKLTHVLLIVALAAASLLSWSVYAQERKSGKVVWEYNIHTTLNGDNNYQLSQLGTLTTRVLPSISSSLRTETNSHPCAPLLFEACNALTEVSVGITIRRKRDGHGHDKLSRPAGR